MEDPNDKLQLEKDVSLQEDTSDEEDCNKQDVEINLDNNELVKTPQPEMNFNSFNELVEYYKQYGKQEGFGIRKNSTCFLVDGKSRLATLSCSRAGKLNSVKQNLFKPNPATKTECKARVNAHIFKDGKCKINFVILEHNHGLSPKKSRFYLCNREISRSARRQLELSDQVGICVSKNYNYFVVEARGVENVPFLEKDGRNYIEKQRRLRFGVGDVEAILAYFNRMQSRNSNFYYLTKMNEDNRMKHVFWADARSRAAYEEFGDVVTFDTTYLTNKYDMPFAIFVRVNHHGQSTLLGCALLSNEDTEAFIGLFSAWLSSMSGQAPNAIITDQDRAMKKAIEIMLPNTRHRWCLCHIMKKIPMKLSSYSMYQSIKNVLHNVVYDSLAKEEFEKKLGQIHYAVQF